MGRTNEKPICREQPGEKDSGRVSGGPAGASSRGAQRELLRWKGLLFKASIQVKKKKKQYEGENRRHSESTP